MKPTHFNTPDDRSRFISSRGSELAFFVVFVFLVQNITAAVSLRSINSQGNETDRVALLAIKSQLEDRPGRGLSSWNDSNHYCTWDGVTCGRKHRRVTVLNLNSRGLVGTISPFIGNLSFLKIIRLDNNSLHGEIPDRLSLIFRLRELWLNNNTLTGEIPANISRCVNLRLISLSYNELVGKLPAGLGALSELKDLRIHSNNLRGPLFDIIQNLTSLETISAAFNSFTGTIPSSIGRMRNLDMLAVSENELSGTLPVSLFNISSLQFLDVLDNHLHGELPSFMGITTPNLIWLDLSGNKFSGSLPITIQNLTKLEYVGLHNNGFTGRVPRDFGNFHRLTNLNLAENYLSGDISFVSTLVNCSKLEILVLGPNNFFGTLPESVSNLSTSLEWLLLQNNPISGTIPAGITNLASLVFLGMSNCKLTGALPHDFGKLRFLEKLYLSGNTLVGKIPISLGNLSFLSELFLEDNKFEGGVPSQLGNCESLLYMDLSRNKLTGTLSNELFGGLATFVEIGLSQNHLEGSLPSEISKQTSLENILMSKNNFSGVIPDGLGDCSDLQSLYMDGNSFHGNIPSSFASLVSFQEIDFSRNNLSGPIPAFLTRFPELSYLNLSYNNFAGRVPTNSVFANASVVFVAGNRKLCGGIKQLRLPKCVENESRERKKRTMSHTLKLIILLISALAVAVGLVTMAIGMYLTCTKKKTTPPSTGSMTGKQIMKVSYNMLLKATNGFSSENLLGTGSFGTVFKGVLDGMTVAVKVLNMQHRGASKSFLAECNTLKNIRHRNLVGVITVCSSIDSQRNDFKALVYEFMSNRSLERWLNGVDGKMSLAQRVDVAVDVAHALNYLHHECETPIVHCDLKPSNILLDNDMVAHVGDFGLARILTQLQHPDQGSTTGIRGTIGYAAPEYGLGSEPSTNGDVYSYGILLLELMTGKSPTDGMFKEDYNLHKYAEEALPDQVLQIVDPSIEDILTEETVESKEISYELQQKVDCITVVISVGVSCSNHLPNNRMKISDAISRLQSARDYCRNARKGRKFIHNVSL